MHKTVQKCHQNTDDHEDIDGAIFYLDEPKQGFSPKRCINVLAAVVLDQLTSEQAATPITNQNGLICRHKKLQRIVTLSHRVINY